MRKQKLSPEASKAKAVRDKKIAMTGHRKKRKNENERMGQRSDSDIHHTKDGKQVRVPIKDNRGNFGKGTKSEGPNMMGQTWLNKRIKGPNAEGDPVKKKKGGVKPYVTTNPNDPRIQAHSDSLALYNSSNQFRADNILSQGGWKYDTDGNIPKNSNLTKEDKKSYLEANKKNLGNKKGLGYEIQAGNDGVIDSSIAGSSDTKAQKELIHTDIAPVSYANLVDTWWRSSKNIESYKDDKIIRTPNPNYGKPKAKDKDGEVIRMFFSVPIYEKPKQNVILKKKDKIKKMPIGKLPRIKSTAPKTLSNRKPENFVYYDKPKKTSLAITSSPGRKARYATVNRGDKKGNMYLTKEQYDKEMKNTFIKIK